MPTLQLSPRNPEEDCAKEKDFIPSLISSQLARMLRQKRKKKEGKKKKKKQHSDTVFLFHKERKEKKGGRHRTNFNREKKWGKKKENPIICDPP